MKLTVTECRNATRRDKPYSLTDGNGLRLMVQPSGRKLWQLVYRFGDKQRTMSFGEFPDVSLKDARDRRIEARRSIDNGVDPMGEPVVAEPPVGRTFREVAIEFHAFWKKGKKDAHVDRVWSRLERDALPEIGDMLLTEITPTKVVAMVRKVEDRGALDVSRRLKQKVGEIFGYAITMEYCQHDPTAHVNRALRKRPKTVHMPAVGPLELPALLRAIDGYNLNDITRRALQFCLLTATRTAEVREATWSEINLDVGLWTIPEKRMKMEREHLVPLSRQAIAILRELEPLRRPTAYIFPGARRSMSNTNFMINALYDLGYRHRQTVHGFRTLFSTAANESGLFHQDWVEKQLSHEEENEVRGAYNAAEYLVPRKRMMQWWADYLDERRADGTAQPDVDEFADMFEA